MINRGIWVQAEYTPSRVSRFAGHPYIEAQPPLPTRCSDILLGLAHYPPAPSAELQRADEVTRLLELQCLGDVVCPFSFYEDVALPLAMMMRDSYVARHPFDPIDQRRRHAIVSQGGDGVPFPNDWKSSGRGFSLIAITGMGKTTLINSFFLHYPQIIEHICYKNRKFVCLQILYLVLRIPHDATLRGFCLNFFTEIDLLIGTKYRSQAEYLHTIAPMVSLMRKVASACSIGIIIVDEAQNIRLAPRFGASTMLNLFAELIETIGVSLAIVGTPAVGKVLRENALNARKLATAGSGNFPLLDKKSETWRIFCELFWKYRYTRKYNALTTSIINAWHSSCAGNIAFGSLAYYLAQRRAIGGSEIVNEQTFEHVSRTTMATLQPAISFLKSHKTYSRNEFEDLLFATEYEALFASYGATTAYPSTFADYDTEEFEDMVDSQVALRKKPRANAEEIAEVPDLPIEQPLTR